MEIFLRQGEIFNLEGDARALTIRCLGGSLWITQPGDSRDHLLGPGQAMTVGCRGRIVVVATAEARVQFQQVQTSRAGRRGFRPWYAVPEC
jgi:hypothetical protein